MSSTPPADELVSAREALLSIEALRVRFPGASAPALEDVSLSVGRGECLGVVGESGAGKSLTFLAALGLLPAGAEVSGRARLAATDLLGLPERSLDRIRGRRVGLVFQDPMSSLTPHLTVGAQVTETLRRHLGLSARAARTRACELLEH